MKDRAFGAVQIVVLGVLFSMAIVLMFDKPRAATATEMVLTALPAARDFDPAKFEYGIASWYGPGYQGKLTAGGFIFDMHRLTLACNHLPFMTQVRVTNLKTGRSCRGFVTDRGPNVPGRKYDLSYAMAKQIGMVRDGLAEVLVEIIE